MGCSEALRRFRRGQALEIFAAAIRTNNLLERDGGLDFDALQVEFATAIAAGKGMGRRTAPVMADNVGITGFGRIQTTSFRERLMTPPQWCAQRRSDQ